MFSLSAFLNAIQQIAREYPVYRSGGTGDDGTCDCVGLIMGAMYRCGHGQYALHGSNYFVRNQTSGLIRISSVNDCFPGMIVYKARDANNSGYSLPDRYRPGGQYCNGDLKDYYHVGVVTSTAPFCISHCTSSNAVNGITTDSKPGTWCYGGLVNGVDYNDQEEKKMNESAVVFAANGKPVNLRKERSADADIITRIPVGEKVSVTGAEGNWASVEWNGLRGYMMTNFLQYTEEPGKNADVAALTEMIEQISQKLDALQESVDKLLGKYCDLEDCK